MRLPSGAIIAPLRISRCGAGCVLRGRAAAGPVAGLPAAFCGRRYAHSVEGICSRLSTLTEPLRVPERENVRLVEDHAEFYNFVYSLPERKRARTEDLVVSVFVSKQNTASLSVLDCVDRLAQEYPSNKFLVINADQVPRAAYDADLQQFPAALLSFGGDIYRRLVQESSGYPPNWQGVPKWELPTAEAAGASTVECTLPDTFYRAVRRGITSFRRSFYGRDISSLKSRCGTHRYTHGIDTDNLNVKRVGWPTE